MAAAITLLQNIVVFAIPALFAITLHEVAHGWVAKQCGDLTAAHAGRLTLNPLKHIDPVGTVLIPAISYVVGGFIFGWAKPVPVDWRNLRAVRRDMALVALAGPFANLLMLLAWLLAVKWLASGYAQRFEMAEQWLRFLFSMSINGVLVNLILMIFNLVPLPPLDGSRVVSSLLPAAWVGPYNRLAPFGFMVLFGLLMINTFSSAWGLLIQSLLRNVLQLFGLPA